jgi:hypothetical protein
LLNISKSFIVASRKVVMVEKICSDEVVFLVYAAQ